MLGSLVRAFDDHICRFFEITIGFVQEKIVLLDYQTDIKDAQLHDESQDS